MAKNPLAVWSLSGLLAQESDGPYFFTGADIRRVTRLLRQAGTLLWQQVRWLLTNPLGTRLVLGSNRQGPSLWLVASAPLGLPLVGYSRRSLLFGVL